MLQRGDGEGLIFRDEKIFRGNQKRELIVARRRISKIDHLLPVHCLNGQYFMYKDALKQLRDFEGPTLYLHF